MKQKGFTLIELLVVIVIIGILATISVATFSGYFAKARDAERQAAVRNISTLLKTSRAVDSIISYTLDQTTNTIAGAEFDTDPNDATKTIAFDALLLAEGGYSVPAVTTTGYQYAYSGQGSDFAVYICSEEDRDTNGIFVDGTTTAVAAVNADAGTICDATTIDMTTAIDANGDTTDETPLLLN